MGRLCSNCLDLLKSKGEGLRTSTKLTRRCPRDNEKNHQRSPWRTSTPYMPTSTTPPKHKFRWPHCRNSLSNSLSAKWSPQVVIDRLHIYILLHQSRGAGKLRFDIDVMMHFHYGLEKNSWSYSVTELVCRRQLYTIKRRSVPSRVCVGVLWRMQWHGEYRVW